MDIIDNLENTRYMLHYFASCLEKRQAGLLGSSQKPLVLSGWDEFTCKQMAQRICMHLGENEPLFIRKSPRKKISIKFLAADLALESLALKQLKSSLCSVAQEWIKNPCEPDWDEFTCRQVARALFKLVSIKPESLYDEARDIDWDLISPDENAQRNALALLVVRVLKWAYEEQYSVSSSQ